jgi:small subunit ribosomal protein S8e
MALSQHKSKRKPTGGKYQKIRKKKKRDFGRDFIPIKIGEKRKKITRGLAGIKKHRILQTDKINVVDLKTKKAQLTKILEVVENKANPHFVRMNVVTRGCVVETELGNVKVTSRPGQDGTVNGVLIKS